MFAAYLKYILGVIVEWVFDWIEKNHDKKLGEEFRYNIMLYLF